MRREQPQLVLKMDSQKKKASFSTAISKRCVEMDIQHKKDARGHTRITMYIYSLIHKNILPDCIQIIFSSYSTVIVFIVSSIEDNEDESTTLSSFLI